MLISFLDLSIIIYFLLARLRRAGPPPVGGAWGGPSPTLTLAQRRILAYETSKKNFKDFKVRPHRPLKTLKNRAIFVRNRPC